MKLPFFLSSLHLICLCLPACLHKELASCALSWERSETADGAWKHHFPCLLFVLPSSPTAQRNVSDGGTQRERGREKKKTERKKNDRMINTMTVKRTSTSLKWLFQISWGVPWFLALQMNSILSSSTKPYHSNTQRSWTQESVLSQAK